MAEGSFQFSPECEVLFEGGPDSKILSQECKKNPGHTNFIPVSEFKVEDLPAGCQTQNNLQAVRYWADLTVKVRVSVTSTARPDTYPNRPVPYPYSHLKGKRHTSRVGSGYILDVGTKKLTGGSCNCRVCRKSKEHRMEYYEIKVRTAAHVVFDSFEAANATVECFYDSEDKSGVQSLYGIHGLGSCDGDTTTFICVTHDERFLETLRAKQNRDVASLLPFQANEPWGIVISHPHGGSKHITVGQLHHFVVPIKDWPQYAEKGKWFQLIKYRLPKTSRSIDDDLLTTSRSIDDDMPTASRSIDDDMPTSSRSIDDDMPTASQSSKGRHSMPIESRSDDNDIAWNSVSPEAGKLESSNLEPSVSKGKEYTLPDDFKFSIPPESDYLFRCKCLLDPWVTLPPGTRFSTSTGEVTHLPPEVEFKVANERMLRMLYSTTYDVSTCPGSSGGPLICHFGTYTRESPLDLIADFHGDPIFSRDAFLQKKFGDSQWSTHSGAFVDGTNTSCLKVDPMRTLFVMLLAKEAEATLPCGDK